MTANKYIVPLLILSVTFNVVGFYIYLSKKKEVEPQINNQQLYPLLSKRIFTENQNDILINFIPLREAMVEHISKMEAPVGVYFEYLPSGSSIGVNDKMEIRLASLIKVPIIMATYKQIEKGIVKKDQTIVLTKERIDATYGDLWKKGEGSEITVMEAVELALTESDNTATNMLISILPPDALDTVYNWLDIPKVKEGSSPILSPKNYTSILRSLYLSSFLTEEHSNEILDILTRTKFVDKLPAGVPWDVKVAHKIGVYRPDSYSNEQVFSDCGIVYVPNRPYALCIMVQGDEEKAREYIVFISKMVYGYVSKINTKN